MQITRIHYRLYSVSQSVVSYQYGYQSTLTYVVVHEGQRAPAALAVVQRLADHDAGMSAPQRTCRVWSLDLNVRRAGISAIVSSTTEHTS